MSGRASDPATAAAEPAGGGAAPAVPVWDTHCHLADERFASDLPQVLARAAAAGVETVVVVAARPEEWGAAAELVRARADSSGAGPRLCLAAGLHPHEARRASPALWEELERTLRTPGAVAVGETGLDHHYDHSPPDAQRRAFAHQLELAARLGLPVVLHERDAAGEVLAVLGTTGLPPAGGVWHCFSGDSALAERALGLGLHLGFGGLGTFPRGTEGPRAAAATCPADRLLLETDAPFLAPVPHRGRRNEPAFVAAVAAFVAALRGQAEAQLRGAARAAARRLFAAGERRR